MGRLEICGQRTNNFKHHSETPITMPYTASTPIQAAPMVWNISRSLSMNIYALIYLTSCQQKQNNLERSPTAQERRLLYTTRVIKCGVLATLSRIPRVGCQKAQRHHCKIESTRYMCWISLRPHLSPLFRCDDDNNNIIESSLAD